MIVAKPKNFRNKIIGQIKAHFLKDNEKVEEKYIGVIKQMMNDYNSYDDEKDKKVINLLAQTIFSGYLKHHYNSPKLPLRHQKFPMLP
ncbi:unnamed protein product [Meloidogyne enterolobii]|uniref:Uncharacterized protein n=1 Tax=Meloidogyne enterolobii TaxID=390850 RepID=A0ACB1B0E9_MELEN